MTVAGNEKRFDSKRYGWLFACLAGIMIVVVFADETLGCEAHSVELYVGTTAADAQTKSHKSLALKVGITEYYVYVEWRAKQIGPESGNDFDIWVWEDLASDCLIVSEENFVNEGGTMSVTLKVDTTPYSDALDADEHLIYAKVERDGTSPKPETNNSNNKCTVNIVEVDTVAEYIFPYDEGPIYRCKGSVGLIAFTNPALAIPDGEPTWSVDSQPAGASASITAPVYPYIVVVTNLTKSGDYVIKAKCGSSDPGDTITIKVESPLVSETDWIVYPDPLDLIPDFCRGDESCDGEDATLFDDCQDILEVSCAQSDGTGGITGCAFRYFYNDSLHGSCIWVNGDNCWHYKEKTIGTSDNKVFTKMRHSTGDPDKFDTEGCWGYWCTKVTIYNIEDNNSTVHWRRSQVFPPIWETHGEVDTVCDPEE